MGQYYKIVNLDKKQYLHPHKFDDGMKLLEFGCSSSGTLLALAVLLSDGNGLGSGDLQVKDEQDPLHLVGSWAGDCIVITGDYADPCEVNEADLAEFKKAYKAEDGEEFDSNEDAEPNLYFLASYIYADISADIREVLSADSDINFEKPDYMDNESWGAPSGVTTPATNPEEAPE